MVVRRLSLCATAAAACALSFLSANVLFAQSSASPDRAAGRMVDSLFEPKAPAGFVPNNKPQLPPRRGIQRPTLQAKLVRNKNKQGEPAFALVDRYGGILRYVEPVEKINLEPYVGRVVGVRHDTGDTLLASQLIFPRTVSNTVVQTVRPANGVQQAAFQEPIPAGKRDDKALLEPIPANEPTLAGDPDLAGDGETYSFEEGEHDYMGEGYGPIYQDEGLDFGGCSNCQDGTCSLHAGQGGYRQGGASPPMSRAYARGEYLLWWLEGMDTPPLVTTSNAEDRAVLPNFPGDNPSTVIAYGGDPILENPRSGFRILLGTWIDECNKQAVEVDYLMLGKLKEDYALGGFNGMRNGQEFWIGRPFFDLTPDVNQDGVLDFSPREAAEVVSGEDLSGTVSVHSSSEFQGAGIALRHNLCRSCCPTVGCGDCVDCGMGVDCGLGVGCGSGIGCGSGVGCGGSSRYVDFLTGFRWYQLDETLQIMEDLEITSQDVPPPSDNGTTFDLLDHFSTKNTFLGGELGFDWGIERNRWSLELLSKIALGSTRQQVSINGYTDVTDVGDPTQRFVGGLLTQDNNQDPDSDELYVGNIGDYDRNRFSMIPELNLTVGYQLTQRCKLRVGYTLMYWTNVVRPGDQIDREINTTQVPGYDYGPDTILYIPSRPKFAWNETNVLIQGLNTGIEYNW